MLEPPHVRVSVPWHDVHMIELSAVVCVGPWAGVSSAYATPEEMVQQAHALASWSRESKHAFTLVAGTETTGLWCLRFYTIDHAGHVACHVALVADPYSRDPRPEQTCRLQVEMLTEPGLIERFAHELAVRVEQREGEAVLLGRNK